MSLEVQPQAGVYSLNSDIWRDISTNGIRYPYESVAYLTGVEQWFVTDRFDNRIQLWNTKRSCITTFGLKDEEFVLMLPKTKNVVNGTMMRLQDSLSLIDIARDLGDSDGFI